MAWRRPRGARSARLNVSRLAAAALAEELDRLARTSALDAYLAELDAELGPVTAQELTDARAWADVDLPADGVPVASVAEADRRAEPA